MIALIANWKRSLYGTALALLGTLLLVQTARIEGFLFIDGLKAENEKLTGQLVSIKEAQKLATKLAKEEKARIEAEYKEIANAKDADIRNRIAAAVARVRDQANSSGKTNLPSVTEAAVNSDGAGRGTVVDDAEICTINTIKAQGWQDWYNALPKP
jgi:hypothetical protein